MGRFCSSEAYLAYLTIIEEDSLYLYNVPVIPNYREGVTLKFGKYIQVLMILLIVTIISGCSPTGRDSTDLLDQGKFLPIADGFDFPVGDPDGNGWGVTGYRYLQWSNVSNSWHPGEDWNIPGAGNYDQGEPVYAIAHGQVVFSGWNTALGHVVLIKHRLPDNTFVWSQYAHLDRRDVKQGDIVQRRQQIGTVGRGPNNRFAAHLHFEIRSEDLPYNAWPRTNGVAWEKAKVKQYWLDPSKFIQQNRYYH